MHIGARLAPRLARVPSARIGGIAGAPALLDQAVTAQKETEGTATAVATLGLSTAGVTLICIDAVRTAIRSGPALNNSNTLGSALVNEVYSPDFSQYSINVKALASASGGSNHAATLTKTSGTAEEATIALIAVASGSAAATSVVRNAAGAGVTLTSASFTVAAGSRARCFAIWSGTGNVNVTAPTATIVDTGTTTAAQWGSPIIAVAFGSGDAPNGHIPLRVWVADLGPGTYTWAAQPAINEGAVMATVVVQ